MSFTTAFIAFPYSMIRNETSISKEDRIGVNIIIDSVDFEFPAMMDFITRFHFNCIFSLSKNILKRESVDKMLPRLYALFTLSGSFRRYHHCIPVFADGTADELSALETIKDFFERSGDQHVSFTIFDPGSKQEVRNSILLFSTAQFTACDELLFEKLNAMKPRQIILLPDYTRRINEELISLKSALNDNKFAKMMVELTSLRMDLDWQVYKSNLWKERSNLYLSFISLGKKVGEQQYLDVIDWYKKEYEVLPLWYKRFGHIIKVLTGKRAFKSLTGKDK